MTSYGETASFSSSDSGVFLLDPQERALLRETGIEATLAPGVGADAIRVVAALPPDLVLRLAGWLRGTHAARILSKLRFPRRTTAAVAHLLRNHPIGAGLNPKRDVAVRKLIKRTHEENLEALCSLRRAELSVREDDTSADLEAPSPIDAPEAGGPGRHVGQALRYLTDRVIEDPALNTPETLQALLADWNAERRDS